MTTNKPTDAPANVRRWRMTTSGVVFAGVVANALTQFAIQAFMSYRFAKDVWDIPQALCVAVICALDLFAVMFMVFTYLLRRAKWYTQLYVWVVFAAGVGAQLFAAEQYGAHERWTGPVRAFAALPALFLAASLHGLIIWRNHTARETETRVEVPPPAAPKTAPAEKPARSEVATQVKPPPAPPKPVRNPTPVKPVHAGRTGHPGREGAVRRVRAGEDTDAVAAELGVSRRAVQIWVKKTPELPPESAPEGQGFAEVDILAEEPKPQVNGHVFVPAEQGVN